MRSCETLAAISDSAETALKDITPMKELCSVSLLDHVVSHPQPKPHQTPMLCNLNLMNVMEEDHVVIMYSACFFNIHCVSGLCAIISLHHVV